MSHVKQQQGGRLPSLHLREIYSALNAALKWLVLTVFDIQSCLLFVVHCIKYAKPACPIATVYVPPDTIEYSIESSKFVRKKLYRFSGLIRRKEWERMMLLPPKHSRLVDQFRKLFIAESPPPNQKPPDLMRYQLLFETLSTEGFATSKWPNRTMEPFYLSIGANGEFLFMTGKHRLALAKVARIAAIPARISARHWKWQAYRDELYRKGHDGEISLAQLETIEHPDLQDIVVAVRNRRAAHAE